MTINEAKLAKINNTLEKYKSIKPTLELLDNTSEIFPNGNIEKFIKMMDSLVAEAAAIKGGDEYEEIPNNVSL